MAKTYSCLLLICLIHQLLCSFVLPSVVSYLSDHVSCGKTIKGGRVVSCRTHDFPRLTLKFESLSSPLSPSSKKPDHVTVDINSLETFLCENETAELSVAVQDQILFQALGKIINPMIIDSQHKVIDAKDEEDLGNCDSSSAGSTGTNSPDASQPEENGQRKIAEAKDDALNENNVGCVEGKCSVSCERICRVHSVGSNVLSSGEANGVEAESVALETPASTPPPPPTDPKPHRTQSPGAQVYHARQGIQALKAFSEDSESCCPLRLIFLFLGLCIARIEF